MSKNGHSNGLPMAIEAERMILAAVFLDRSESQDVLLQAINKLKIIDFGLDSHRRIFGAMIRVADRKKGVDFGAVEDELRSRGELEAIGGSPYVLSLTDASSYIRLRNIGAYCDIVLKAAAQRQLIHAAAVAQESAYGLDEPEEIAGRLQAEIDSVTNRQQSQKCVSVADIGPGLCRKLISDFDKQGATVGLPTGIQRLDRALGGLVEGENIVVAGYTGGGKTAFALNIVEQNCPRDVPVTFYSFELDRDALMTRLAAKRCGIPQIKIRNKAINSGELSAIMAEIQEISRWPLWIDDRSGMSPRELYASARMQAARGARLFVTDYIQLFSSGCPGHTVREQVNLASATIRAMAKDCKVPVLNLSQLSRPGEKASPRKPTIYDLKESGNIEQDAHNVILLWREFEVDAQDRSHPTGKDSIIVGKNRNGPLIEIAAEYEGPLMYWKERDSGMYRDTTEGGMYQ